MRYKGFGDYGNALGIPVSTTHTPAAALMAAVGYWVSLQLF